MPFFISHLPTICKTICTLLSKSYYDLLWIRSVGNKVIINHLKRNRWPGAAFYPLEASSKIGFKCNIYDYKPFLTHTESIIH